MKKILEIAYLLWNFFMVYWSAPYFVDNYLNIEYETIQAGVQSIVFTFLLIEFFLKKYLFNKPMGSKAIKLRFLYGFVFFLINFIIVLYTKIGATFS